MRVLARVQSAQDARVQLLHAQRLLLQRRGVSILARRPAIEAAAVPALRHGFLSVGTAVREEARAEEAVRVLSRGLLS